MKKTLVALAVLGTFTSIASAQSSVTLYGRVDQNVTIQDPGKNATSNGLATSNPLAKGGKATTKLNDGGTNGYGGSRIGFKGTEDLGNGLKAFFQLEGAVASDTGAAGSGSSFFSRGAYLGLSHKTLGEIRLGRQETLTRENNVKINDITGENSLNIVESGGLQDSAGRSSRVLFQNVGARINNGIRYTTPSFAGIQASALVGLGERETVVSTGTNAGTTKAANYRGLAVVYTGGPLALNVIYEDLSGGVVGSDEYNKVITVGGSYDFGFAKVAAAYQDTSDYGLQTTNIATGAAGTSLQNIFLKGVDVEAWNIGVAVPFNAFTFRVQYTGSTMDTKASVLLANGSPNRSSVAPNKRSLDQHKYGATLQYALSKRTSVYATANARGGDDSSYFTGKTQFALGVGHSF
jgi:predicted porin